MDKKPTTNSSVPVQSTSPEEDATLLAIEALEARSVDPNPRPLNAPRDEPVPPRPIPTRPVSPKPKYIEPVVAKLAAVPTPIIPTATPKPVVTAPPHVVHPPLTVQPPAPAVISKPKKVLTTSEKMDEALTADSTTKAFQFFAKQSPTHKAFIVAGIIIILIGIGITEYFVTH